MAEKMMLQTVMDEDFTNPRGQWVDEGTGEPVSGKDLGWDELAAQQRADDETAQINANRKAFDQFVTIEQGAKQQKLALDHQRAIAGAAMLQSAFRNGGMSDSSLSQAFSAAFGMPVYGGQLIKGMDIGNGPETVFAMYGAGKDPQTGKATIAPVAMLGSRDIVRMLKSAKIGDVTNDLQNDIIDNSYLGKLTDDQRAAAGVSRPSAPISTGTTVISGAAMRALRGTPRVRYTNGGFGANGDGGFTTYRSGPEGFERDDSGTRAPDRQAKWKVLESHADYTRYENDQTGEVVKVPKGETLQNVVRGTSEKEKIARIQAQGRADAAQAQADNRLAIAKLNADQRREAATKIAELRQLGIEVGIDLAEARSAESAANAMDRATTGVSNRPKHSAEEVEAQRKKAEEARNRARQKTSTAQTQSAGQAPASSGYDTNKGARISRAQLDRAIKLGAKYDKKTGTLTTKDGRTMKIAAVEG